MSFLKSVFENIGELGSIGDQARADARAAGIDSYYIDPERQGLVLLEHPDGRVEPEGDAFQNLTKNRQKMTMEAPECLIIAGPNGGGKSTVYRRLQERSKLPVDLLYINTDDNVKILERSSGRSSDIAAARMSIESLNTAIADRQNFAFETTLSSNHSLRTIEKARQAGYRVGLIYVLLRTVELHNARIRTRVAHGGHFVAEADVARRYRTSLRNLAYRLELFDEGYVIDNSGANSPRQLIKVEAGRISKLPDFDAKTAFDIELWDLLSDFEPPW